MQKKLLQRLAYLQSLEFPDIWRLMSAVLLLFSVLGFVIDLFEMGRSPIVFTLAWCFFWGVIVAGNIGTLARRSKVLPLLIGAEVVVAIGLVKMMSSLSGAPFFPKVDSALGIRFAAVGILIAVMASYGFFLVFIQRSGAKSIRSQTELAVAHQIQQRLVPVIDLATERFEVFAQSRPSENVGGDLAGLVERDGATYAYIADVSGHGMQSGLLMNMLTTAIRTALLDAPDLPTLLQRLNTVLPEVKEPQMYTTFAGLRFSNDGRAEVALCGHPPILMFRKSAGGVSELSQSEFPIGLFPSVSFSSVSKDVQTGDIYLLVTDGILEASTASEEEFGIARVSELLNAGAETGLRSLAERIFDAVDAFGSQLDDQTLLIVRVL